MINILVADEFKARISLSQIEETAQAVIENQKLEPPIALSVVVENDDTLQNLNRQFREIDSPTDVLSFAAGETDPETGETYLGDIVLSFTKAEEQAKAAGHSLDCEMRLLITHGFLHLLGYDHHTPEEKNRMWSIQDEILKPFGCSSPEN